ncbi:hypothetical protein ROZALSC1DRAFT_28169 [Rozella allomycis CSF55]|uniref:Uncharacterized protein n=1 Tax=Rozella allomycis (strain CSF55) TaxID=988480 RepID=A0A075AT09_ROZAC|nr:hypothetical protein O9G_001722 [Rozella allomycis CSF55]RKP20327.1 hypothetical protein ROZALSC1DRAFT_28168 [Rozella allomycis CSF55]RKP20329.1 hypothetical protein ROZALSC1DRAFT_28169 [Rozella allomycis CSF55]|eukprot:EPZ33310.1 hypothetical protein O9G_001722 [Rozella allomycis CSF55]
MTWDLVEEVRNRTKESERNNKNDNSETSSLNSVTISTSTLISNKEFVKNVPFGICLTSEDLLEQVKTCFHGKYIVFRLC